MSTVMISGASRGIGRATAIKFAKMGYNVVINYLRSQNEALALENEIKSISNAMAIRADVGNYDEVLDAYNKAIAYFGHIDVVVCNAGISTTGMYIDTTRDDFEKIVSTNLGGVYNLSRVALPDMTHRGEGSIVMVSSIWGLKGASTEALYSMTKHGVVGLSKSLADEYEYTGVRINCICPGMTMTDMTANYTSEDMREIIDTIPSHHIYTPQEMAQYIYELAVDKSKNGTVLTVAGGMEA